MSSYSFPLSSALSSYLAIQPNPSLIAANELVAYSKLLPEEQARIAPLLQANVPPAQAKTLAQGDQIKYRMVIAMLGQSVALSAINTNLESIAAYGPQKREGILVCLEKGITFADAKTLIDRL